MIDPHPEGAVLHIRVQPKASRDEIKVENGRIRVRLSAPPVDGAANRALTGFIAKKCRVPKSRVSLVAGEKSRDKTVLIRDLDAETARDRLLSE